MGEFGYHHIGTSHLGHNGEDMPPAAARKKPPRTDKRLGRILREKRTALKNTPDYPDPERVGERVGMSQTNIYRLETGEKSLRSLTGEQTVELLRAYGFRSGEIEALMKEHDLNAPASRPAEHLETNIGAAIAVPYEGTVSTPGGTPAFFHTNEIMLGGHNLENVRARFFGPTDYATPAAHADVLPNTYLLRHTSADFTPRDFILYRAGDLEFLAVVREGAPSWVSTRDPDVPPRRVSGPLEVVGGVISTQHFHVAP